MASISLSWKERNLNRALARIGRVGSRIIDDIQKVSPDRLIRAVISWWKFSLIFLCVGQWATSVSIRWEGRNPIAIINLSPSDRHSHFLKGFRAPVPLVDWALSVLHENKLGFLTEQLPQIRLQIRQLEEPSQNLWAKNKVNVADNRI